MKRMLLLLLFVASIANAADSAASKSVAKKPAVAKKSKAKSTKKNQYKRKTKSKKTPYASFLNQLPAAEKKKLEAMYRSDPKAFQREIRIRISTWKKKNIARESKETYSLIRIYQRERNPAKKKAIKNKLAALVRKQFLKRLKDNQFRIKLMEKKIVELKKKCAGREKNTDKIVEERVRYLTSDPSLRW